MPEETIVEPNQAGAAAAVAADVPAKVDPKRPDPAKEEASQSPFSILVGQVYEGPLDLLLDLIRKQSIDIYDIPIAKITQQFLAYCEHLKQTDVDAAGEFIYMASLLIHIKSKMLLPREAAEVAAGEAEDPRRELVERLLEHEKFKAAAQMLLQKQQIEEAVWTNPGLRDFKQITEGDREIAADTVDLVRVFQEILDRMKKRPVLNVDEESVTVAQMIEYVKRRMLMEDRPVSLRKLLLNTHSQRALICMFLAMLELVRLQAVLLRQSEAFGDIMIKRGDDFDKVMEEQTVRDDWR